MEGHELWSEPRTDSHLARASGRFGDAIHQVAGFHRLNASMFSLARSYTRTGMPAYADLQMALVPVLAAR